MTENTHFIETTFYQDNSRYGYAKIDGLKYPIIINKMFFKKALNGDKVLLKVKKNKIGFVQKVIERNSTIIKGQLNIINGISFLKPWSKKHYIDFFIPNKLECKDGDIVEVQIVDWKNNKHPEAKILNSLHSASTIDSFLYKMGIKTQFSDDTLIEVLDIQNLPLNEDSHKDLREFETFSIDPEHSTDIDDAISFIKTTTGYKIYVHISDVSHFIKPGTSIDKEAYDRGCSVYLSEKVIHMLPEKLSSDLLSLKEGKDRFAITFEYVIDDDFTLTEYFIYKSIINVYKNYTYEEFFDILNTSKNEKFIFFNLLKITAMKLKNSYIQSNFNLNIEERKFMLDENGNPIKIYIKNINDAHNLIQNLMLVTNYFGSLKINEINENVPFLYRTQEDISDENIKQLKKELIQLNINWIDDLGIRENILLLIEKDNKIINNIILNKFKSAEYSSTKKNHFALGTSNYSHFTSPIRRYSDIINHRILNSLLNKGSVLSSSLNEQAIHLSNKMRNSEYVTQIDFNLKMCKFINTINFPIQSQIIKFTKKFILVKNEFSENKIQTKNIKSEWLNIVGHYEDYKIGDFIWTELDYIDTNTTDIYLKII